MGISSEFVFDSNAGENNIRDFYLYFVSSWFQFLCFCAFEYSKMATTYSKI